VREIVILSGGQTGVDRGALDAALEVGVPCQGWCPEGRLAEDGVIDQRYPLAELPGGGYAERTSANVRDSDGTLVLVAGEPDDGTRLTIDEARRLEKSLLVVDIGRDDAEQEIARIRAWIAANGIRRLNVAGPRESNAPGSCARAKSLMTALLRADD
jgi:hypothetical protein